MPINPDDLVVNRAAVNNDSEANGGTMSSALSVSGTTGNILPRVTKSERENGITRIRKVFHRVRDPNNRTLFDAHLFKFSGTPADDAVTFIASTEPETQGDVMSDLAVKTHYGVGHLVNGVSAGATTVQVEPEQTTYDVFRESGRVYLTSKESYDATSGDEEEATISSISSLAGGVLELTLTKPLTNAYPSNATVSSIYEVGDVRATIDLVSNTSVNGSITQGGIIPNQRGAIYDEYTITFTSSTAFTCESVTQGTIGSGNRNSTFSPVNPQASAPYFSISSGAWSGTFVQGDEINFKIKPAAVPVFYVHQVPEGTESYSGNNFVVVFGGESE